MKTFIHRSVTFTVALLIANLFFISKVNGQNIWDGSTSTAWNTTSNWSLNHVPTSGENVVIGSSATITNWPIISVAGTYTINSLTINGRSSSSSDRGGSLRITINGVTLNITQDLNLNGSTGGSSENTLTGLTLTGTSSSVSVGGNINMTNGTTTEQMELTFGTGSLTASGNVSFGSSTTFNAGTGTATFNASSGTQTLNDATADNFNIITKSGAGTLQLLSNAPIITSLTISAGTFDLSTFTANRTAAGTGPLTISNGATLKIGSTNTFPSNYNTHSIGATSTIEYGGTNQAVAALNSSQNYGNLSLSGSGNKTFSGAMTITNNFSISGTAVALLANTTTSISGTLTLGGSNQSLGTWGGSISSATNKNSTYFGSTTTGILNVGNCPTITATATKSDISCFNTNTGVITVNVPATGTAPFKYSIYNGSTNPVDTYQLSNSFTGLGAAAYQIRIKDANGCLSKSVQ